MKIKLYKGDIFKVTMKKEKERRKYYNKKRYQKIKEKKPYEPKIKGSIRNIAKPRHKTNCFITLQERQAWLRLLMSRGIDFDDAKERVSELVRYQAELRKEGKSESQIKKSKEEFLQELYQK